MIRYLYACVWACVLAFALVVGESCSMPAYIVPSSKFKCACYARVYLDEDGGIFDQDGGMDEDQGMLWTRMEACLIKTSSSVSPIQNSGSNRDKASCPSLPSCIYSSYVTTFACNYYRRAKLE